MPRTERFLYNETFTTDSAGNATVLFPPTARGFVLTGSAVIPLAGSSARWVAKVGISAGTTSEGTPVGAWPGDGPYAPLQVYGEQRLILVGTGLPVSTTLVAVYTGQSDSEGDQPMTNRPIELVQATSDGAGDLEFAFSQVPLGTSFGTRIVIPLSPDDAQWLAYVGGTLIGGWKGQSPYGPVWLLPSDVLTVVGSNAAASTTYTALIIGSINTSDPRSGDPYGTGADPGINQDGATFVSQYYVTGGSSGFYIYSWYAGSLLSIAQSPRLTIPEASTLVEVFCSLNIAGTSNTVVTIYHNGAPIGTVTLGSGVSTNSAVFATAFAAGDYLNWAITTLGTGASDLEVRGSFT